MQDNAKICNEKYASNMQIHWEICKNNYAVICTAAHICWPLICKYMNCKCTCMHYMLIYTMEIICRISAAEICKKKYAQICTSVQIICNNMHWPQLWILRENMQKYAQNMQIYANICKYMQKEIWTNMHKYAIENMHRIYNYMPKHAAENMQYYMHYMQTWNICNPKYMQKYAFENMLEYEEICKNMQGM